MRLPWTRDVFDKYAKQIQLASSQQLTKVDKLRILRKARKECLPPISSFYDLDVANQFDLDWLYYMIGFSMSQVLSDCSNNDLNQNEIERLKRSLSLQLNQKAIIKSHIAYSILSERKVRHSSFIGCRVRT
jgi:hypothetical protein